MAPGHSDWYKHEHVTYLANQILPPRLFCICSYQGKALFFLVLELKEYMSLELPETTALASQAHPA